VDIGAGGIIFGFVVILWVAYVLPLVLLRYDEAQRKLPISGSFSRVIRRSEPKAEPVASSDRAAAPRADRPAERLAARKAARRRRLVLYSVTYLAVMIGAAAAMRFVPLWTPGVGVLLVVGWLVACRYQVTIERGLTGSSAVNPVDKLMADYENTVILSGQVEDHDPDVPHVMEQAVLETTALDEQLQIAVPSPASSGAVLWDPLPVTLPTYVTKPRAGRTVRTIDFEQPGTWTSGHIEGEQTQLPGDASAADDGHPEAVGT
jgi:hypothetical protein